MAATTVELRDGGYVEYWIDPSGTSDPDTLHVQKHNADGSLAGPEYLHATRSEPTILPLSNGGYVVGIGEGAPGGTILRGEVFAADGGHLTEFVAGREWNLVASEDGAFAVTSTYTSNHYFTHPDGFITVYANDGSVLAGTGHVYSTSGTPTITTDADGIFHVAWTEGSRTHELAIDPRNPPDLASPAIPAISYVDDNGPELRVTAGGWTNDNTPTIRVPVSEAGYVAVGAFGDPGQPRFEITADDLAHGYKDVPLASTPLSDGTATFEARVEDADGMVSGVATMQIVVDTQAPGKPAITHVTDDQGLQQGDVANGGTTDDTTPTFQIALTAGTQANDIMTVSDNGATILTHFIDAADLQRGYITATISRGDGQHSITAGVRDQAGNSSASDAFTFTTQSQTDHGAGAPRIGDNSGSAGVATLYEKNLPNGTAPDSSTLTYANSFAVTSPDGIAQLSIDGHMLVQDDAATFTSPQTFTTGLGETLTITGYDAATHTLSYSYNLSAAVHHQQSGPPPVYADDRPFITVVDHDGDTAHAILQFGIVDDGPKVVWDTANAAAGTTVTGNVLANDLAGADGAQVANAFSRQSGTRTLDANGEYTVQGDFGAMHIKPDGSWTYVANAGVADGSVDRFQFAVSDSDGSSATSTDHLDITIGAPSADDHTPSMVGGGYYGGAVSESDLPFGSAPDPTQTEIAGTVTLHSQDGFSTVKVGNATVFANGTFSRTNASTAHETVAVTGFDQTTGVLSFTYKLLAAADHSSTAPGDFYLWDSIAVSATDMDGDVGGGNLTWQIYDDKPTAHSDTDMVAAGGTATGNVITDASSGDLGDSDDGADQRSADGIYVSGVELDGSASGQGGLGSLTTPYGTLGLGSDGSYTFHANADAPAGTVLNFNYFLADGDKPLGRSVSGRLTITIEGEGQGGSGQTIHSPGPGSTLEGGGGNDTIYASQGPDVISTGAGSDVVVFQDLPWSAGHITDFAVGTDHLDLSAIFQASGYTGSDPVADGRISFQSDGAGGTRVYFDRDQPNGGDWPFLITTLDHVSPSALSWAQLSGSGPTSPPPPPSSTPQLEDANHETGNFNELGVLTLSESALPHGTRPNPADLTRTGAFYVSSADGVASLTIAGHQVISQGAFVAASWDVSGLGTLSVTGYDAGSGRLDYSFALASPYGNRTGYPFLTTQEHVVVTDGDGDQAESNFYVRVYDDGVGAADDVATAQADGASVSGDLLANDRGADGLLFAGLQPNGAFDATGAHGTLHVDGSGAYTYTPTAGAGAGADTFQYRLGDSDGSQGVGTLTVTVEAGSGSSGQVINSPGPGSTLNGTAGDDTINASQGPDVITTGAGADVVAFHDLPWNAGHVTDFALGSDKLDLSAIFQASGYAGSDPVADGRMTFQDDGAGGTKIYFDHDQLNGGDWPFLITTLDHVSASAVSWAQLSTGGGSAGGGGDPGGGSEQGQVITSDQYGDTLVGGSGDDTLNAGQGPDVMSGDGGADHFVFNDLPWRAGAITDFTPGVDKLDLRPLFQQASYSGSDPIADHHLQFRDDGQGNTAVYFDRDDPNGGDWPFFVTTLQGVTPGQIGSGDWLFR